MFHGRTHLIRVVLVTAGIAVLGLVWSQMGSSDRQPMAAGESAIPLSGERATPVETPQPSPTPVASPALSPDDKMKPQFLGVWFHAENGEQWIENRADGTARMLLKLDFLSSLLYGQELHLDLTWNVKDGVLSHTIVSGSPTANVNKLVQDFGKSLHYAILETTPERMLLLSKSDKQKDLWTRTPAPMEWAK